jgi:hypothetical protein
LANTAKGLITGPLKGAWGLGEGAGEIAGHALMGDATGAVKRTGQFIGDVLHGIGDPIEHVGAMTREYFSPGSEQGNVLDPAKLAQSAEAGGGNLSGLLLGAKQPKVMAKMPEDLMNRAANVRKEAAARPDLSLSNAPGMVAAGNRLARRATGAVLDKRAPLYERAAEALAGRRTNPLGETQYPAQDPFMPEAIRQQPFEAAPQTPTLETGIGGQARNMQPAAAATTPEAMIPRNPNADMLKSQLRANDGAARWANANADHVYEIMPELRGLERGSEAFRVQATNAFKNLEANMKAAQESVPPETRVPTLEIKQALGEIQNQIENVSANLPAKAKIALEIEKLAKPSLTWKEFLTIKDEFRKIPNFMRDRYLKQAYGKYMDAASKAGGPELAKANKDFSTAMRLNEHAGIDVSMGKGQGQYLR